MGANIIPGSGTNETKSAMGGHLVRLGSGAQDIVFSNFGYVCKLITQQRKHMLLIIIRRLLQFIFILHVTTILYVK